MKQASLAYKQAMAKQFRDRAYGLLSVGVVNKEAQSHSVINSSFYLSNNKAPLKLNQVERTYASFEENHTLANGSFIFPPENNELFQLPTDVGAIAENILEPIIVRFNLSYDIKGLTIDFGTAYPTEFTVSNGKVTYTYTLNEQNFTCTDVFEKSTYLEITPIHFINGDNKRLRINYILMGIGITFDNDDISEINLTESVSYCSEELPSIQVTAKIIDSKHLFNVDDTSSFINFLADGQELDFSLGQTLADGSIEYIDMPKTYLSDWKSNGFYMSFTATDRIKLFDSTYSAGNYIHTRTLYDDAIAVLTDMGLEPDEYFVDTCLQDVTVSNPLPTATHRECLQLIANAGRCSLKQSQSGKTMINGNFENIIEPTDLVTYATGEADWSNADNVRFGSDVVYADFTRNFAPADGSMLFLPEDSAEYLEDTTFVSAEIADINGNFTTNPTLTLKLPAAYNYFGVQIIFNGNHPEEMTLQTYYDDTLLNTYNIVVSENNFYIPGEFIRFNKFVFTFTKGYPRDRILVNKIALGELTDYRLVRMDMKEEPVGFMEKRVKDVQVKIFSFTPPEEEGQDPQQVEDSVYYVHNINSVGQTVTFENQLIGTQEHAQQVAEWLANYYANNISYEVKYRGDPRLDASDIIFMDSKLLNNLQVEIESLNLKFTGAYLGTLNLRRAINMISRD